jgi:hypothetical protein
MNTYSYNGNPNLRQANSVIQFTREELKEYVKCKNDFHYFCEKYCKILVLGKGFQPFLLRDYQKEMSQIIIDNRFFIGVLPRQSGKSTVLGALCAWYVIFNDSYTVFIAAQDHKTSIEITSKVKDIIEYLPHWLKPGTVKWNEGGIELDNNSRVMSSATTKKTGRGFAIDFLLLDEFAFVEPNIADDFFTGIYATISSTNTTKMAIISTPNGMNLFYDLWQKANNNTELPNSFIPYTISWKDVPGRDETFRNETIAKIGENRWMQEFECKFLGGESTLISPDILQDITTMDPIEKHYSDALKFFKAPVKGNNYFITVDVSRGKGIDSSAFIVVDITRYPFEVVCHYSDPNIQNLLFPSVINKIAMLYNEASVLVEINDNGQQIADLLFEEWEYPNILGCVVKGRIGQLLTAFGPRSKGIKTSASTKRVGCANLKTLIETRKLKINSFDIVRELSNFILQGESYGADKGLHDDLVMCLVNFAWASQQLYFRNYVQLGLKDIYIEEIEQIESLPFGVCITDYDETDNFRLSSRF